MLRIVSLCDNVNNSKDLWSVEGNSLLIDAFGQIILFDPGRCSNILCHNLSRLNIHFDDISAIILSHGHMGHIGALRECEKFINATIYYGTGLENPKFKFKNDEWKEVKNEKLLSDLKKIYPLVKVNYVYELIKEKVYLFKSDSTFSSQSNDGNFFVRHKNDYIKDQFNDEINMCIKTSRGLVLISGCAHCGIESIIQTAIKIFNDARIYEVLGGTHLLDDVEKTNHYINLMKYYDVSVIAPSHCTGVMSRVRIAEALPELYVSLTTGEKICFKDT